MSIINSNQAMKNFLRDIRPIDPFLSSKLEKLLNKGFRLVDEAIFFSDQFEQDFLPERDFIRDVYTDISGYEFSMNKLHLEDYCESPCLEMGVLFVNNFLRIWEMQFSHAAIVVLTYDKTEFGETCTFQFHKKRQGELVIDISNIEKFSVPILVIDTSSS